MTEDMNSLSQPLSEFDSPPINEVVCGILFNPIEGFCASHFGALWNQFKSEFPKCEAQSPIVPIPEDELKDLNTFPLPRVWFVEESGNRLIQVQRNRFLHNWRKRQSDDPYPGYDSVIADFEKYLARFKGFLTEERLESLDLRRYEMTYIDHIPKGEGWETLSDIGDVFTNFVLPMND